jgi:hypothetical protein
MNRLSEKFDYIIKLVILGDTAVGENESLTQILR